MGRDPDCIFCRIVSVQIPAAVVYETNSILSFLDVNPLAEGHLLVVPREHYASLTDLPVDVCRELFAAIPKLGRALLEATGASGYNVLVNNGEVAGQVVMHSHFHLIPRIASDGLGYRWNAGEYAEGRAAELAASLQQSLLSQ